MINRQNWLDVQAYIRFQSDLLQVSEITRGNDWTKLRPLIEWADDKPFEQCAAKRPTFISWLETKKNGRGKPYASNTLVITTAACRAFLVWAKSQYPGRYKRLNENWVHGLRPSRSRGDQAHLHIPQLYTLDEVRKLVAFPATTVAQRRLRAAVAFLFLSGMRVWAFTTLPVRCVDIEHRTIIQSPEFGVHTKLSKARKTYLLKIPDLLAIVAEWDAEVRATLPGDLDAYWYMYLTSFGKAATKKRAVTDNARRDINLELEALCKQAGVVYRSAHKFRHGHAVYGLKRAKTFSEMRAISQNLMHENTDITVGVYGELIDDDVRNVIDNL